MDTYNTLKSGIPNAIKAFNEVLKPLGITKCGIRLDSGDLAYLTRKAREGRLDDINGRDREFYRTIQILSRRQKNNPCLIGEAGVGKTAIAEGIAERIARGEVPAGLKDKEIYLLDLTSLVAGTQFRGQFEQRVKGLLSEVKAA